MKKENVRKSELTREKQRLLWEGIYNTEEYQHFAVIHVRLPRSGNIHDIEIELNEFQVQMAIDKLPTCKIGEDLIGNLSVNEHKENEVVI